MANSRFYSSTAQQTTLTGGITPSDTTMAVASTAGFPGSLPYTLAVDYGSSGMELVEVTGVASLTLTVTRAIDGTSGAAHSVGAVVRHVASARDFTDSRTHEDASTNVHGLTGGAAVVGTTSTQTLTNKTLSGGVLSGTFTGTKTFSEPTTFSGAANLNAGGALVGTFSGTHTMSGAATFSGTAALSGGGSMAGTFSGAPTFSGIHNHTTTIQSTLATVGTVGVATIVSGDTFDRFRLLGDGDMEWGPGNAARDTNLYRGAANQLNTDDSLVVGGTITATGAASFGYNEVTTGITYATDWGAGSMNRRSTAGVNVVIVEVVRTGATFTPASSSGNVTPDLLICTLPAGSRPNANMYVSASTAIGDGTVRVQTNGEVYLLTWDPDPVTITNGSTIRFTTTWIG